ncbi:MAG: mRNA surveillance protein pelota [Candidatus Nanohaloarchaea archaeon]
MKLLKTNRSDGYARVEVENRDDLWYLKDIIGEGDVLEAVTQRTKLDGREKKTLSLSLEVEKTEYEKSRLRVTGEIREADEDVEHGYHTFNLEPGKEFEIWKDFSDREWKRLKEAENRRSYQVLFCLVEKGKADLFLVEESGISSLSKLQENIPGKLYDDQKTDEGFHDELVQLLERSAGDVDNVILAGPGFQKEKVYDMLPEKVKEKTFTQDTSVTGETGLNEAIKRGALERVVEESRVAEELERDGEVEYGEPVGELAEMGAVEKLVMTEQMFREHQELVRGVEQQGGEVVTVHTDHEAGERLENFGGIAAILRYNPDH